jgi:hypothetical protein
VIECDWEEVTKANDYIKGTNNTIKHLLDTKLGEVNRGKGREEGGKKEGLTVTEGRVGNNGVELNDHITIGRIKSTMHLGTGARRREHLRIINGCKDAMELKAKLGMMRIWRVEISQDKDEDRVARDGYCGYSSMAQIINHTKKKYNLEIKADRMEVAKAVRKLIDGAPGVIRIGCKKFRDNELSPKERAEITYRMLMADKNHFLAYKGLDYEYWMRGMLIDGRSEELKFSSWTKSH